MNDHLAENQSGHVPADLCPVTQRTRGPMRRLHPQAERQQVPGLGPLPGHHIRLWLHWSHSLRALSRVTEFFFLNELTAELEWGQFYFEAGGIFYIFLSYKSWCVLFFVLHLLPLCRCNLRAWWQRSVFRIVNRSNVTSKWGHLK